MLSVVTAATVTSWILSKPAWLDRDVTREARAPQVNRYAEAIVDIARTPTDVAMLLAHGYEDTKFAYDVLRGACELMPAGQRCDGGKARGAFGLHLNACPAAYRYVEGSAESIHEEVRCTLALLHFHGRRCLPHAASPMLASFGGMGGTGCHASRAAAKTMATRRIAAELAKMESS